MLYTRKQLEVVKFVSKDETRYTHNGIYLDPGGDTIATNGHILVKVHANGKAGQNEAFPKLKSGAPIESLPKEGAIVPADIIKDVIKNIPRNMGISICEYLNSGVSICTPIMTVITGPCTVTAAIERFTIPTTGFRYHQ